MAQEAQSPLIEMEDLEVRYGTFSALKDIVANVSGGAVGLLGPNGAGKSTLIKALLGLLALHKGQGRVMGLDVSRSGLEIRRRVGYMPERDCHIPGMNGFEYVAFCGRLTGMPSKDARRRAHEVLEYVGLGEARYRPVDGYSAGMRQRVKLAQALVHDPHFIILDEPTNGFDPKGREEVLELIYDISHRKGMHLLLSSHLLKDVERTCDSVLLLKEGVLIKYGVIRELKAADGKAVSLMIKGDVSVFSAKAEQEGWRFEAGERNQGKLYLPADTGTRAIFEAARAAGVQIRSLEPTEESLEDIFMRTIEG
jgi:ABC-2 type transport system ATP-binding protein